MTDRINLKALAKELKQTAAKEEPGAALTPALTLKAKKTTERTRLKAQKKLKEVIVEVNHRNDFELYHHVYIDTEIYEILRALKTQTKLKLGNLASVVLEEFIRKHKGEIIDVLKHKRRRLL